MDHQQDKAKRICAQDLAQAARAGVERALAARQGMTELTAEQVEQVSGAGHKGIKLPPVMGVIIKPPVTVGVVVKPPIMGVVLKPPVVMGFAPAPAPVDPAV
jgi:hypothetical protein